jgi:hypothetical protein
VIPQLGMRFIESPAACTYERVRTYPKRRAKNASHLRRMNNKWLRRYGMRAVPQAYMLGEDTLVVHPALANEYRMAVNQMLDNQRFASYVDNFI